MLRLGFVYALRLAREGVRFTQASTTAGVCAPSRAAIITGIHQNVWGAGHMRAAGGGYAASPPAHVKAFPELLRAAGYYTVNDGKTNYQMGLRLGGAYGGPETLWDRDGAPDWSGRSPGQPFFAHLNLSQTHESQVWPTWMLPDGWLTLALWPIRVWNHLQWPLETDPARVVVSPYYPDTECAVRDARYKYIRHFRPELPYVLESGFRDQMPMMRELCEISNFAANTEHRETLERMRASLDDWLARHVDLGLLPEEELRASSFHMVSSPLHRIRYCVSKTDSRESSPTHRVPRSSFAWTTAHGSSTAHPSPFPRVDKSQPVPSVTAGR